MYWVRTLSDKWNKRTMPCGLYVRPGVLILALKEQIGEEGKETIMKTLWPQLDYEQVWLGKFA